MRSELVKEIPLDVDEAVLGVPAEVRAQGIKPRMRGLLDVLATVLAVPAAVFLIVYARPSTHTWAALVYGLCLVLMFAVSATYHTPMWPWRARRWLRRLDHSMIYAFIAGTYTPVCAVILPETIGAALLPLAWGAAALGLLKTLIWPMAPRALTAGIYVLMGWGIIPFAPQLYSGFGAVNFVLILLGGVLYSVGSLVYARRWPDPYPTVFGYHEIFHVFVIAAAACHYVAMWDTLT